MQWLNLKEFFSTLVERVSTIVGLFLIWLEGGSTYILPKVHSLSTVELNQWFSCVLVNENGLNFVLFYCKSKAQMNDRTNSNTTRIHKQI